MSAIQHPAELPSHFHQTILSLMEEWKIPGVGLALIKSKADGGWDESITCFGTKDGVTSWNPEVLAALLL